MKIEVSKRRFLHFPFNRKLSINLILLCYLCAAPLAFAADVEQPEAIRVRQAVKQAKKLFKKGDLDGAEKILRPIVEANPKESAAKLDLAYILFKKRLLVEAYNLSFKVVQDDSKNAHAHAVFGTVLLSVGNFNAAATAFNTAIRLNNSEALAWAGFGLLNFYENHIDDSLKYLNEAIYYESDNPDFVFAYGQVAARAEQYKEAAAAYRKYLFISTSLDNERRERIKGLINFLNYLGNQSKLYVLDGQDKASVDITLIGNRPMMNLKVNNSKETLRFVLDTGSNISVISNEAAEKLNIKPIARGGNANGIGGDGKFEIVYGFLRSVEIGDVRVRNVPVYIRKFHQVSDKVDGYIGLSMISKFLTTLDYGDLTFSLVKRKNSPENSAGKDKVDDLSQPLRQTPSGFLSGEVQIQGIEIPLNFIVDTGASVSVISDDLANTKQFNEMITGEKMSVTGAAGVTNNVPSFLLPRLSFGKNSREKITAISLDLDLINETSGFEQSGILGGNFLKNYRLIFDFENSKVIFQPITPK